MNGQNALKIFLESSIGKKCLVVLSNGVEIVGTLCTIDGLFNLVLKDAEETVNVIKDQKPNTYSSVFVRGSNVVHITPVKTGE